MSVLRQLANLSPVGQTVKLMVSAKTFFVFMVLWPAACCTLWAATRTVINIHIRYYTTQVFDAKTVNINTQTQNVSLDYPTQGMRTHTHMNHAHKRGTHKTQDSRVWQYHRHIHLVHGSKKMSKTNNALNKQTGLLHAKLYLLMKV